MPDYVLYGMVVIAIIIIAWLFATLVLKNKKPVEKTKNVSIDIEELLRALGNKENIKKVEATASKISFGLFDTTIVNTESLKQLGATGIVESGDKVTVIFGRMSKVIATMINEVR